MRPGLALLLVLFPLAALAECPRLEGLYLNQSRSLELTSKGGSYSFDGKNFFSADGIERAGVRVSCSEKAIEFSYGAGNLILEQNGDAAFTAHGEGSLAELSGPYTQAVLYGGKHSDLDIAHAAQQEALAEIDLALARNPRPVYRRVRTELSRAEILMGTASACFKDKALAEVTEKMAFTLWGVPRKIFICSGELTRSLGERKVLDEAVATMLHEAVHLSGHLGRQPTIKDECWAEFVQQSIRRDSGHFVGKNAYEGSCESVSFPIVADF